MKAASIKEIKQELSDRNPKELVNLCLQLARFKKENKELLTYLLFEAVDEHAYIQSVKNEVDLEFEQINRKTNYLMKKSVRKILRGIKKHIRYSKKKETEVELLLYFCSELKKMHPPIRNNVTLMNIFNRQIETIKTRVSSLHEDLQFDYTNELDDLVF